MTTTVRQRRLLSKGSRRRIIEPPDFLEIQRESFKWFLDEGLKEELLNISPIKGPDKRFELYFTGAFKVGDPKYSIQDYLIKEITYSAPLKVGTRLVDKETGEVKSQEVFIGDLPIMTERGTFIINGAERVIVSQLVRSPGVYYRETKRVDRAGRPIYYASVIPDRGSWLEIETDASNVVSARINRTRKIPITTLLCAIGCTEKEILASFVDGEYKRRTFKEGPIIPKEEALIEIYKKMRPGDPITVEGAQVYLNNLFFNPKRYDLGRVGRYKMNRKLVLHVKDDIHTLTKEDLLGMVKYLININLGSGMPDDIDHLGNRRIRSVGELLQRQFRVGLSRVERLVREQMVIKGDSATPQQLINIRPLTAVIREFFGSSQLSQFMDQTNPLAELTHKRRLSALGPGGLTRERAGFEVRDIHPSHYGRICPIETPEGPNAGLIASLGTYGKINKYGFIETPYRKVVRGKVGSRIEYLTADIEDLYKIAPCDVKIGKSGRIIEDRIPVRYKRTFIFATKGEIDYVGVAPEQLVGVTTALIPFLEHDDANRALMGANMQRQAVPLLQPEAPYVGTGLERQVAENSRVMITARSSGKVRKIMSSEIIIETSTGKKETYRLMKFQRSNQNTCLHQRAIVRHGEHVVKGQIIADASSTSHGELALGKNILVALMPWEGYNYEDAILVSERLVRNDTFTSVHIERYEVEVRATKLGMEEITREIPNVSEEAIKNLDDVGIIAVGAEVNPGDILVGKVTPKGETELPAEEKLLRAIFGDKARDMRDTSLRVPPGEGGKVVDIKHFTREAGDELPPGVHELVRVYIAQLRKVSIGDKLAGRHGNKGVVAKVLPDEDMPYLPDGSPIDVVLNPLGVPSRMNIGQIFELLLGEASHILGRQFEVPPFDESLEEESSRKEVEAQIEEASRKPGYVWLSKSGKVLLRDGRTGKPFEKEVAIGYMYLMKLIHLVDDKMHARSTGPYSLITQQPLGGKAQFGGQRFGEMEVWALEGYGAAYTLQEMLTIKSDDVVGRSRVYESIIKGKPMTKPGIPESFKVLVKELRSLGLDLKTINREGKEISIDEEEAAEGKSWFARIPQKEKRGFDKRR